MQKLKIATWNVNSVRFRLALVTRFLRDEQPDVLCLQETKVENTLFPGGAYYAIRTKGELGPTVAVARDAVRQIDARASLDNIATMDRIVANSLAEPE